MCRPRVHESRSGQRKHPQVASGMRQLRKSESMAAKSRHAILPYISTRSVNEYIAQTFGAQYAWQRPLEKGKSLSRTCGICS